MPTALSIAYSITTYSCKLRSPQLRLPISSIHATRIPPLYTALHRHQPHIPILANPEPAHTPPACADPQHRTNPYPKNTPSPSLGFGAHSIKSFLICPSAGSLIVSSSLLDFLSSRFEFFLFSSPLYFIFSSSLLPPSPQTPIDRPSQSPHSSSSPGGKAHFDENWSARVEIKRISYLGVFAL